MQLHTTSIRTLCRSSLNIYHDWHSSTFPSLVFLLFLDFLHLFHQGLLTTQLSKPDTNTRKHPPRVLATPHFLHVCSHINFVQNRIWSGNELTGFLHDLAELTGLNRLVFWCIDDGRPVPGKRSRGERKERKTSTWRQRQWSRNSPVQWYLHRGLCPGKTWESTKTTSPFCPKVPSPSRIEKLPHLAKMAYYVWRKITSNSLEGSHLVILQEFLHDSTPQNHEENGHQKWFLTGVPCQTKLGVFFLKSTMWLQITNDSVLYGYRNFHHVYVYISTYIYVYIYRYLIFTVYTWIIWFTLFRAFLTPSCSLHHKAWFVRTQTSGRNGSWFAQMAWETKSVKKMDRQYHKIKVFRNV